MKVSDLKKMRARASFRAFQLQLTNGETLPVRAQMTEERLARARRILLASDFGFLSSLGIRHLSLSVVPGSALSSTIRPSNRCT